MKKNHLSPIHPFTRFVLAGVAGLLVSTHASAADKLRVLILSGANNHDWRHTTPAIKACLEETGRFTAEVEENVASLKPEALKPYAVVLSDFNTFGQDASKPVWDAAMRKAFIDHLQQNRGLVIVHAGSSVFYDWPEFQKLACGSWKEKTSHGPIRIDRVAFTNENNPITAGLKPFWIRDEFWENVGLDPAAKLLAQVEPPQEAPAPAKPSPILFSTEAAGARGFAIFLGHDPTSMKNTAWRSLLQRGTEWAATGKVTLPPDKDWPATPADAERMAK